MKEVRTIYAVTKGTEEMKLCARITDHEFLEKMKREGQKNKPVPPEYKEACKVAEEAWEFGCELLHTQMAKLIAEGIPLNGIDENDYDALKKQLKRVFRAKLFGPGGNEQKQTACICNKSGSCPIAKKYNLTKQTKLPLR